jgi:hypothetical protein
MSPTLTARYRIPQSAIDEWRRVHEQRRTA